MIISLASIKGGAAKSLSSQTLAVYLRLRFPGDSLIIVDTDRQATSYEWSQLRNEDAPTAINIECIKASGKVHKLLTDLYRQYDWIIVDTGGSDSIALRSALSVSHVCLVPMRPKKRDMKAASQMSDMLELAKAGNRALNVYSFVSQTPSLPSQSRRIKDAKEVLSVYDMNPLSNTIAQRNSYDDVDELGLTVLEYGEDVKAKVEARALFDELLGLIAPELLDVAEQEGVA